MTRPAPSAWAHWMVGAAGGVLLATAIVLGALDGFSFADVVQQSRQPAPGRDVLVLSVAGAGAFTLLLWLRARTAARIADRHDDA